MLNRLLHRFVLLAVLPAVAVHAATPPIPRAEALVPVPADQPIPVIDFFRPYLFADARLNRSGTKIAALNPGKNDTKNLVIYDLGSNKLTGTGGGEGFDIYNYQWLTEERLLFRLSRDKHYAYGLFAVDASKLERAIPLNRRDVTIPIGVPRATPLNPIVWVKQSMLDQGRDGGVVQLDSKRGADRYHGATAIRSFPSPKGVVVSYRADHDGELAYAITTDRGVATLHRLTPEGWKPCPVNLEEIEVLSVGEKSGELIVLAPSDETKPRTPRALRRLDSATGQLGEIIHRDDRYEPNPADFYRDPKDDRILGLQFTRKGPETVWFDPNYQALQEQLNQGLPGMVVRIISSDSAQKKFLIHASSDQNPGRLYLLELSPQKFTVVSDAMPWIDPARMAPMQIITYRTRDDLQIEGYYTAPTKSAAGTLPPLVVLPHGGPWGRDRWCWDAEAQFLASRGYAVFQPNYRGSSGTTWRFPESDQWAFRKMHDDVTDGVKRLIQSRLADPDRVAIMGTGFGGYLAVCGAAFEGSLYRCAITVAGVYDWERVMRDAQGSNTAPALHSILRRRLGDPKELQAQFEEISPLRSVAKIAIPVFIAHGRDDPIVSVGEAKRLIDALEKNRVPHEVMLKSGESQGFRFLENRVELYTRIEDFLAKHLAPRAAAAAP